MQIHFLVDLTTSAIVPSIVEQAARCNIPACIGASMRILILLVAPALAVAGCPQQQHVQQQKVVIGAETTPASAPAVKADEKVAVTPSPNLQLVTTTFKVEGMDCKD